MNGHRFPPLDGYDYAALSEVLEALGSRAVKAENGGIIFGSVVRILWGRKNDVSTGSNTLVNVQVNFSQDFSEVPAVFISIITPNNTGAMAVANCTVHIQSITTTYFIAKVINANTSQTGSDFRIDFTWLAIGLC